MKKEIKEKWLEALRSGRYQQDRKYLKTLNGYCCLGVLCDIKAKEGNGHWVGNMFFDGDNDKSGMDTMLSDETSMWAGMVRNIRVLYDYQMTFLSDLNDTGLSFLEIADLIEEQL